MSTATPRAGEYLRDELVARGLTPDDFAKAAGQSVRTILNVIDGAAPITHELAQSFAAALVTSPELWLRLEAAGHVDGSR